MDEPEGLTDYERWQVAVAVAGLAFSLAFTIWFLVKEDQGLSARLKWWREQQRRKRAAEADFQRSLNWVLFEAWEAVHNAPAI